MWELGGSYGSSAIGRKSAMVVAEIIKERKSRIYVSEFEGTEEKWKIDCYLTVRVLLNILYLSKLITSLITLYFQ